MIQGEKYPVYKAIGVLPLNYKTFIDLLLKIGDL
jgi:hypothetical protein